MASIQEAENFHKIYSGLNEQQKLAVDTIEGPVMVIAGPGTGKTQILGARIGKILIETDARPENILCLTYTDAGAVAMRKRLLSFIGPDAYKVNLFTFHAFCNEIIQENLSLFEKTSLDPISELESIELYTSLIDGFPKNHPLKRYRGDVYFEIKNLRHLFSSMKREGWSPTHLISHINQYLEELPTKEGFVYKRAYKSFKAGEPKSALIEEEKEKMEKLRAAVNEFDRFQELMRQKNRYDFDDMINWVIRAFTEEKNLLARYQEQFQYILVDEYQDTSGTQNRLIELLIHYWDQPNVFVVGDDDQSIYRFQGANLENMLDFAQQYQQSLLTVVLTNNYRSTQPILDAAKILIDRNTERLVTKMEGLSKTLTASHPQRQTVKQLPVLLECETQPQEMIFITNEVEKLVQQGIAPGRIGIIYKENKYGETLAQYFKQKQIPVFSKRSLNILDLPLARKILLVMKYLSAEHDVSYGGDEMLFEILHFDWFAIAPIDIARMSLEVAEKKFGNDKTSLRKALYEKANTAPKELFSIPVPAGMKKASTALEGLVADVPNVTLCNLFTNIVLKTGLLRNIREHADNHWLLQVLNGLFDFVKEETRRNPLLSLDQFVKRIELMEKEGISLPLVQVSGSDKGVNLMTVHGSKGLEFQYVFFAGCNASNWEKKRKPGGGYALPDTLFTSQVKHSEEEELRRLFYVALTRAEQHLFISYSKFRTDGKELEPSMFVAEVRMLQEWPITKVLLDDALLSEFTILEFEAASAPEIDHTEADFITHALDRFVMNVTALNNYLKCPLQFYFNNLLRVPLGKSEAIEFGSAVHFALQKLFEKMIQTADQAAERTFPPLETFIGDFEWYMRRHRESFTREQFARRLEYGHEVLTNYYQEYSQNWTRFVTVERNIRNVVVKGVPLKGKLDKLEFDGKEVNVVDYKTGDIDKAREKIKPPHQKDPNGGDYWRQAVFYKILVDNYEQKNWQVISTEFDFIEPDKKKRYRKEKIVITPEDTTTVTQQIRTVWEKIQQRDFYTGCGKEDCQWCNFVKTNDLAVAFHAPEETNEQDD